MDRKIFVQVKVYLCDIEWLHLERFLFGVILIFVFVGLFVDVFRSNRIFKCC